MQVQQCLPCRALAPYVHSYWEIKHDLSPDVTLAVPFGCTGRTHVVISLQTPFQSYSDSQESMPVSDATLFCQVSRPYTTKLYGPTLGVVIQFTATGLYALWSLPLHDLSEQSHDLATIVPFNVRELVAQLCDAQSTNQRFARLEAFMLRQLANVKPTDGRMEAAVRFIQQQPGVNLGQIASQLNCSERTLRRRFIEQVGHSPKYHARIQRFLTTWRSLKQHSSPNWTDLLATGGYYDQSHFINEFGHFTGQSPQRYVTGITGAHDILRQR